MVDEFLRYETNRRVRQILVSHHVDMTRISYSCVKKTIHLYGSLNKSSQWDFNRASIEGIVMELMSLTNIRDVQFDLDNWLISAELGKINIKKAGRPSIVKALEINRKWEW